MEKDRKTESQNWGLIWNERLFSETDLYTWVEDFSRENHLEQTLLALPLMKQLHAGQVRKGPGRIPYIYHPLLMACHSIAMGMGEDELLAVILLHDVCEDCGVFPEQLPVNEKVRQAVACLTFSVPEGGNKTLAKQMYYQAIAENRLAIVVKAIDRCNNISTMATGFSRKKMADYILETEEYVLPLLQVIRLRYPMYQSTAFLLEYQMKSVMESLKRVL